MDVRTARTVQGIAGWFTIAAGLFSIFMIVSGQAWNCPQPYALNLSRIVGGAGQIALGIGLLLVRRQQPKLSLMFIVPAIIALLIGVVLFVTTASTPCMTFAQITTYT